MTLLRRGQAETVHPNPISAENIQDSAAMDYPARIGNGSR